LQPRKFDMQGQCLYCGVCYTISNIEVHLQNPSAQQWQRALEAAHPRHSLVVEGLHPHEYQINAEIEQLPKFNL